MRKLGGVAGVLLLLFAVVGVSPARAADTATVSVLHGIPGATVDVWANGKPLLTNFAPGTLTDPTQLPAGTYDLKVVQAGAGLDATAVVEAKGVTVPGGANVTVVAHLTADGKPALTPFVNSTDPIPAGRAKLTVRHVAAAPGVDVRAGWSSRHLLRTEPSALPRWLIGIAKHRIADLRRTQARSHRTAMTMEAQAEPSTPTMDDAVADRLVIAFELERLGHPRATIVRRAYVEDVPLATIAEDLGMPLKTVKSHAKRGLAQLRERLRGGDPG